VLYCGAVMLVGIIEAEGVGSPEKPAPDTYVSLSLEDEAGENVRSEHQLTRTVLGARNPQWDEVLAVGQKIASFDDVKCLKLSIKRYGGTLGGSEKLGTAKFSILDLMEQADAEVLSGGSWQDKWVTLVGEGGRNSRLRLFLLFHRPPSLPCPVSLGIWSTAGHNLGGGSSYITVSLVNRLGERVRDGESKNMRVLKGGTTKEVSGLLFVFRNTHAPAR